MGKGVIAVWSNPISDDKEAEYNAWYNGIHISELTAGNQCRRVTRYKVSDTTQMPGAPAPAHKYLAIYEFDDLDAGFAEMAAIETTPGPINLDNNRITLFEQVHDHAK